MNTRNIIVWVVVLIVVLGGIYLYMTYGKSSTPNPESAINTATTTQDTVQGQDVTIGTGAEAKAGATVSILYIGALADGTIFDSSEAHATTDAKGNRTVPPLTFVLGEPGLIPGFQIGVNGMKEGGERKIAIPPALGYGAQEVKDPQTGNVIIPANSVLVFDIKLVKVIAGTPPATQ